MPQFVVLRTPKAHRGVTFEVSITGNKKHTQTVQVDVKFHYKSYVLAVTSIKLRLLKTSSTNVQTHKRTPRCKTERADYRAHPVGTSERQKCKGSARATATRTAQTLHTYSDSAAVPEAATNIRFP
jgi:hypothetical protein